MNIKRLLSSTIDYFVFQYKKCKYYSIVKKLECHVLTPEQTVDYIINNKVSVSRYGDGEFRVILGSGNGFQKPNKELGLLLDKVLKSKCPKLLVCVPYALVSTNGLTQKASRFWHDFIYHEADNLGNLLDSTTLYGDTNFTRFYIDHKDKSVAPSKIESIKQIWLHRDVYIVEGTTSRLGVGNDLFSNVNSLHRILCPSKNAFDSYDRILDACETYIPKTSLIICALGMTATVLAYTLTLKGYQVIDIGHVDVEYEWMLMGAEEKCAVKGKSVNEVRYYPDSQCEDIVYKESITTII